MILLIFVELVVSLLILHGDTRMPAVIALMVDEEQSIVELYAVGLDFLTAQAEGRRELSHETRLLGHRDLPDTEEAKDMVDAVGVEVFGHLAETTYPPAATVGKHRIPVVGGEAPVLAVGGEGIRRCTSLSVQVEVLRLYPSLDTIAADADGNVAFQDDLVLTGIGMGGTHLLIEVELDVIPESHLFIYLGG